MLVFNNFTHLVLGRDEKGRKGRRRKGGKSYECGTVVRALLHVFACRGDLPWSMGTSTGTEHYGTRFLTDVVRADRDPAGSAYKRRNLRHCH